MCGAPVPTARHSDDGWQSRSSQTRATVRKRLVQPREHRGMTLAARATFLPDATSTRAPPTSLEICADLLDSGSAMWDSMFSAGTYGRMPQRAKDKALGTLSQVLHARHPTHRFTPLPGVRANRPVSPPAGGQVSFEITSPNDQAAVVNPRASTDKDGVDRTA